MPLRLVHEVGQAVELFYDEQRLFRYVYVPKTVRHEVPKPYFHPVSSLKGDTVTLFRPHDHVWHHGLAMTLADVSGHNFWGGPTWDSEANAYRSLNNHGRIEHRGWSQLGCSGEAAALEESLQWIGMDGWPMLDETRQMQVRDVRADQGYWAIDIAFLLTNATSEPLEIGSPTTLGRPNAGYGGLFWRGPRSFQGGRILAAGDQLGEEMMGKRASWLAFLGAHDGSGETSTVVFCDHADNPRYPTPWFVRSDPYPAVCFAFAFDEVLTLQPEETLALRYGIMVADAAWPAQRIERFVSGETPKR